MSAPDARQLAEEILGSLSPSKESPESVILARALLSALDAPRIAEDALREIVRQADAPVKDSEGRWTGSFDLTDALTIARSALDAFEQAGGGKAKSGGDCVQSPVENGAALIAAERVRQTTAEGWTADHDDDHREGELALAAACYAIPDDGNLSEPVRLPTTSKITGETIPPLWPWEGRWYKRTPHDRVRELVKAGALVAAEIDRLQRRDGPSTQDPAKPEPPNDFDQSEDQKLNQVKAPAVSAPPPSVEALEQGKAQSGGTAEPCPVVSALAEAARMVSEHPSDLMAQDALRAAIDAFNSRHSSAVPPKVSDPVEALEAERDEAIRERDKVLEKDRQIDNALAVLDASAERITDGSQYEWIIEYRWKCGPFHKLLGLRSHLPALAHLYKAAEADRDQAIKERDELAKAADWFISTVVQEQQARLKGTWNENHTLAVHAASMSLEFALAGVPGGAKPKTVQDDYEAFRRGTHGLASGLTWHSEFARCPQCQNATVGLAPPYAINHAPECSAPAALPAGVPGGGRQEQDLGGTAGAVPGSETPKGES